MNEGWMSGRRSGSSGLTGGMAQLHEPSSDRTLQQKRRRYKGSGMSRFADFLRFDKQERPRSNAACCRREQQKVSSLVAIGWPGIDSGMRLAIEMARVAESQWARAEKRVSIGEMRIFNGRRSGKEVEGEVEGEGRGGREEVELG